MSAKGTRHLKILKNNVSETVFPAFLHDFGGKYKAAAAYDLALCFQFVFGSGFEHKCRFFTTVAGRQVSEFNYAGHEAGHLGSMSFIYSFDI